MDESFIFTGRIKNVNIIIHIQTQTFVGILMEITNKQIMKLDNKRHINKINPNIKQ